MFRIIFLQLMTLVMLLAGASGAYARQFNILVQYRPAYSLSPEQLREMGSNVAWCSTGLPVKIDETGKPVWTNEKARQNLESLMNSFEGTGITVIVQTSSFDKNTAATVRFRSQPAGRCFSGDASEVKARLRFLVHELSRYNSFGGLVCDDEPGVPAGGCICDRCRALFKERYRIAPPTEADYYKSSPSVLPDNYAVLLWTRFQEEQIKAFYKGILDAVGQERPNLPVYTIPAAPFYAGKQLSMPGTGMNAPDKGLRFVTLDDAHIRDYQMYIHFYINRITASGWQENFAGGMCATMVRGPVINFCNVPILNAVPSAFSSKERSVSVPAFRRFILQTFSEGAKGIVYYPGNSLNPEHKAAAAEVYAKTIKPICERTGDLHRPQGRVAVLYSDTTRAMADIWRNNLIERYEHLHRCDALTYYLLKKGIPFEVVMEDEISRSEDLERFKVVLSAGVTHLRKSRVSLLSAYIKKGGRLILDKGSRVVIPGMKSLDFDASRWYEAVVSQTQRPSDLEYQAGVLDGVLSKELQGLALCNSSSRGLNVNYLTDGRDTYLFLVNDDLDGAVESELSLDRSYRVSDLLTGQDMGVQKSLHVSVDGLKVLKIAMQ